MSDCPATVVWFRRDLRFADNPALAAAIAAGGPVIPVYIHAPEEAGAWAPGAASNWWLHQSLGSLAEAWRELGGKLVLRSGPSLQNLREIIASSGARRVYWNRRYELPLRKADDGIRCSLERDGIEVKNFNASLLVEPDAVCTGGGSPYRVYTPFWKNVHERDPGKAVEPDLKALRMPTGFPLSTPLEKLGLLPKIPWYRSFYPHWTVSAAEGLRRLDRFLASDVERYHVDRDRPDIPGTSMLSPYLSWGQISPRQIMDRLHARCDLRARGPAVYMKEIYWREFAYHILYHYPNTPDQPLRTEFSRFPWQRDEATLHAWQRGRTGYPIVDAGMRQLWQCGWMHNRVRMIVSSLLVKHLLHSWKCGAKWFWDTLVDADLASNTLGWQWSGGCGADAAPYFRIFNPIIQGKKFDPEGDFVRRFVPELAKLDTEWIHTPWEAPPSVLRDAGIRQGVDYPEPLIEHSKGRQRALEAFSRFNEGD